MLRINIDRHMYGATEIIGALKFTVKSNTIVAIMAPSGSGKSTLMRLCLGLECPTEGFCDLEVPTDAVGAAFQEDNLLPWFTAWENALLQERITKHPVDHEGVRDEFSFFGLWPFRNYYPSKLSTGMKQMVALCRVLSFRPKLYALDEAFSHIDEIRRQKFLARLRAVSREDGSAGVVITHNPGDALQVADEIVIGSPRPLEILEVYSNPLSPSRDETAVLSEEFLSASKELGKCLENSSASGILA